MHSVGWILSSTMLASVVHCLVKSTESSPATPPHSYTGYFEPTCTRCCSSHVPLYRSSHPELPSSTPHRLSRAIRLLRSSTMQLARRRLSHSRDHSASNLPHRGSESTPSLPGLCTRRFLRCLG